MRLTLGRSIDLGLEAITAQSSYLAHYPCDRCQTLVSAKLYQTLLCCIVIKHQTSPCGFACHQTDESQCIIYVWYSRLVYLDHSRTMHRVREAVWYGRPSTVRAHIERSDLRSMLDSSWLHDDACADSLIDGERMDDNSISLTLGPVHTVPRDSHWPRSARRHTEHSPTASEGAQRALPSRDCARRVGVAL